MENERQRGMGEEGKVRMQSREEEEESGERWTKRKRAKENFISWWNNLSFITLMEKQGVRMVLDKVQKRLFHSFCDNFQLILVK